MWGVWNLTSIVSCLTWLEEFIWQCLKMPHLYMLSFSTIFLSWISEHFLSSFPFKDFSLWSSVCPLFSLPQEWSHLRWCVLALADHSKKRVMDKEERLGNSTALFLHGIPDGIMVKHWNLYHNPTPENMHLIGGN